MKLIEAYEESNKDACRVSIYIVIHIHSDSHKIIRTASVSLIVAMQQPFKAIHSTFNELCNNLVQLRR